MGEIAVLRKWVRLPTIALSGVGVAAVLAFSLFLQGCEGDGTSEELTPQNSVL